MKVKIKEYFGKLPKYLTVGKVYDVVECIDYECGFLQITDDEQQSRLILIDRCSHLNGGSWEVVSE